MNESDLEAELCRLAPAAPRPELEDRIARALAELPAPERPDVPTAGAIVRPPERTPSRWRAFLPNLGWAVAGALAGVTAIILVQNPAPPARPGSPTGQVAANDSFFEPVGTDREVVSEDEPELVYDDENHPAQVVRTSYLERYTWSNPRTGARVEVEMPREDVRFLPVSYQ
jgi:hypothetical protein